MELAHARRSLRASWYGSCIEDEVKNHEESEEIMVREKDA